MAVPNNKKEMLELKLKTILESIVKDKDDVPQYDEISHRLFKKFLEDKSFNLVESLKKLERKMKRELGVGGQKSLWFKFFDNDTSATDIRDIENYLSAKRGYPNYDYFLEAVQMGVENNSISTKFS